MPLALAAYRTGDDLATCRPFLDQLEHGPIEILRAIVLAIHAAIVSRDGNNQSLADDVIRQAGKPANQNLHPPEFPTA